MVNRPLLSVLLIASTMGLSWHAMQAVHEFGHVIGAIASGGRVERVVLHPLTISQTDVSPNPNPLLVVWCGPLLGILLPLAAWGGMRAAAPRLAYLARFFAGFCLVANGAYIGVGAAWPVGDAEVMRRLGVPAWLMAVFGIACVSAGLALWHRLGPAFGLDGRSRVRPGHALAILAAWVLFAATLLMTH